MVVNFWATIGSNPIANGSDVDAALAKVSDRLLAFELVELVDFHNQLGVHIDRINLPQLASIPVEFPSGVTLDQTTDHFLYARCACVLAGERSFNDVLRNAARFGAFVAPRLQAEKLLYIAVDEYFSRTGERMTGVWLPS